METILQNETNSECLFDSLYGAEDVKSSIEDNLENSFLYGVEVDDEVEEVYQSNTNEKKLNDINISDSETISYNIDTSKRCNNNTVKDNKNCNSMNCECNETISTISENDTDKGFDLEEYLKQKPIYQEIRNACFRKDKIRYYHSRKLNKLDTIENKNQLESLIMSDFPSVIKQEMVKNRRVPVLDLHPDFINTVFYNNNITEVIEETDLFSQKRFEIKRMGSKLFIIKNTLNFCETEAIEIEESEKEEIVREYRKHFKEVDRVLKWMVACRFTDNRRTSFLHLRLYAGFGKSFFKSILKNLNFTTQCLYSDFTSPSPLKLNDFENTFSMLIDEFTIFKKEFKDMTNEMKLASKYSFNVEVKLYSKIFLSAEKSNSFTGGVDEQISDRINILDKHQGVKLEDRELFKKYGSTLYRRVIEEWALKLVREEFKRFIDMGKMRSQKEAEDILKEFNNEYKLKTENILLSIKKFVYRKIYDLYALTDKQETRLNKDDKEIKNSITSTLNSIVLKSPKTTIEKMIRGADEDFYKKSIYKMNAIEDIFDRKIISIRMEDKVVKGLRFSIEEIKELVEREDEEILDIEKEEELPY